MPQLAALRLAFHVVVITVLQSRADAQFISGWLVTTLSDSLKDQLLKAGFKETKAATSGKKKSKKNAAGRKNGKNRSASAPGYKSDQQNGKAAKAAVSHTANNKADKKDAQQEAAALAEKKRVKAAIKEIIEASALKDHKGETAYSFVLGKKVRQLYVNEDAHKKLSAGEWVITRLNGNTHVIPIDQVEPILALNPDWAIVQNQADGEQSPEDDEYKDFQIPDDLNW